MTVCPVHLLHFQFKVIQYVSMEKKTAEVISDLKDFGIHLDLCIDKLQLVKYCVLFYTAVFSLFYNCFLKSYLHQLMGQSANYQECQ